jgi:hypothetical protein
MTRAKVFKIRFAATAFLLLLAVAIVRLLWYPGGYFAISGVSRLLLILVVVVVVLGPGLSAVVYKPGKPGLRFDFIVIACVEIAVLGWALFEIRDRRPAFTVFAVDRFEVIARSDVDLAPLGNSSLVTKPGHTPRLIYAELPSDPKIMNQLIDDTVFLGKADIDRRPEFWRSYAKGVATVKARSRPLSHFFTLGEDLSGPVKRWLARRNASASDYAYLPIRASGGDAIMIVHKDVGYPVGIVAVDPW